ncbi:MAG: hypothetical protein GF372_15080 [Candidatus Marinimicrobia bacterium]|nr:hypothetical protein [Candidatus Neomarinimicrobiota bacterium]
MTTLSKKDISELYELEFLAKKHKLEEKIHHLLIKYDMPFEDLEEIALGGEEDFEKWDDYMEWKALQKSLDSIERNIKDLQSGNFRITE